RQPPGLGSAGQLQRGEGRHHLPRPQRGAGSAQVRGDGERGGAGGADADVGERPHGTEGDRRPGGRGGAGGVPPVRPRRAGTHHGPGVHDGGPETGGLGPAEGTEGGIRGGHLDPGEDRGLPARNGGNGPDAAAGATGGDGEGGTGWSAPEQLNEPLSRT